MLHDIDSQVRKAWLVDGLSALLHLVRANLSSANRDVISAKSSLLKAEALEAKGGYSGREVAFETLQDFANRKLRIHRKTGLITEGEDEADSDFYCLEDTVKHIMHLLEQILDHQADQRTESSAGYRIRTSPWAQMEGFDFMDIATKSNLLEPRAVSLRSDGEGWAKLTRALYAPTLFGKGFGELLEPLHSGDWSNCGNCHWNSYVPAQRDVLAVSVNDLERIIERRGSVTDTYWRIVDDFYLDLRPELFLPCSRNDRRGCHQRVQKISQNKSREQPGEVARRQNKLGVLSKIKAKMSSDRKQLPNVLHVIQDTAPIDFSKGGVLLGTTARRSQRNEPQKIKPGRYPVGALTNAGVPQAPSPEAIVSSSSGSNVTTQDRDTTLGSSAGSTSITEPSRRSGPIPPSSASRKHA